jgi:hypothetical protein
MKRVWITAMIGVAAVALLSLIASKSSSSNARVELTRIQTSPEIPGGRYPGSENQVLLEFTNRYPGRIFFGIVRTEVLTERGWQPAVTFASPDRLFHPLPTGVKTDSKTLKLWAPAPPGKQPWRAVVRYRRDPRRGLEQRLDTCASKIRLCYPPFHDLTTRQINQ